MNEKQRKLQSNLVHNNNGNYGEKKACDRCTQWSKRLNEGAGALCIIMKEYKHDEDRPNNKLLCLIETARLPKVRNASMAGNYCA